MKMAIAIQCHNKPEIINELIKFFNDCDIDIYIHVDKKSNIYNKLLINTNVYMIKNRIDVQWGKFSQVEACLLYTSQHWGEKNNGSIKGEREFTKERR